MIKKLARYVGKYKIYAILTPLSMVGEVIMEILIPLVMASMIDKGIKGEGGLKYTVLMGLLMVGLSVVSMVFGAMGAVFGARAGMGFAKNLRGALFAKVQDFSFGNTDKFSTASLVTRLTTDVTNTQNAFMMIIRMAFRSPIMLVGATVFAIKMNPRLATILLVAIPVLAIILFCIISVAHKRFKIMLEKYDELNRGVQENLSGIRVVKSFVREEYEIQKFNKIADSVRKAQVFAEKLVILNMPTMQITVFVCIVSALFFGGNMVIDGTFLVGQLSSFVGYVSQILMSLMMLSMIFIGIVISRASITRICEVLDEIPEIDDVADSALTVQDGSVEFKNVSFSYFKDKENLALENVNLKIESGQTIGIIGGTGSSKTTLVSLIPRLYDVLEGEILVGGHNVKEYSLENLRNSVGMVLQKNVLFSGTIKENLCWGNPNATDQQIENACRAACAHDFICSFPDGYDTYLGQGGVNLSGGQKQRVCIARALLKNPKIIILDDSTSAVDTATDKSIRDAFKKNLCNTTTFIIAQRISSVKDADRIIVIENGKIDDMGTHDELLARNEIYREVYNSQQKGDDEQ